MDNFLKLQFNVNGEVQIIHEKMNVQIKVNYDHSEKAIIEMKTNIDSHIKEVEAQLLLKNY